MQKKNYNPNEINFRIANKSLAKNIRSYCSINHINFSDLATQLFTEFFNDEKRKLELMTKEQLIEVILTWRKEDK